MIFLDLTCHTTNKQTYRQTDRHVNLCI